MDKNLKQTEHNWEDLQENLANESGLAVVLVDGSGTISKANNNSVCEVLYSSAEFTPRCDMFCGRAFEQATAEEKTISVKCHADIHYHAVPLKSKENKHLVAIVGRTFLKSEDYRNATTRAIEGDWQQFPAEKLFQNVLLSSSENEITKLSKRIEKLSDEEQVILFQSVSEKSESAENSAKNERVETSQAEEISQLIEAFQQRHSSVDEKSEEARAKSIDEIEEIAAWRSLFSSLLEMEYKDAFALVADFLAKQYQITTLAWLENRNNVLESVWSNGKFSGQQIQISIPAADSRFLDVIQNETSLELREQNSSRQQTDSEMHINLFPVAIGGRIRSALVIGDELHNSNIKRQISRLIKQVASEIEILRLREEIKRQSMMTSAVQKLNQTLKLIDNDDFWSVLAQNSAELMSAERGSILVYDENSENFEVKAAVGNRADVIKMLESGKVGERVAQNVLRSGRPLIVRDAKQAGFPPSPADWKYKTDSFISYPIVISGRNIGVLNLTDKVDGGFYDEKDLEILNTLAPQIALAVDRRSLMRKAGEFEQLSITDSLTGLVNRRYLEERLAEEVKRSQRHGYPFSFLMIDVDAFKSYNDTFGHTEGDKALQLVGQCLKSTLRGADVAARYGGEEFSILLPQTTLREAITIAERIRHKVETMRFPNRQVTVSIGIASCSSEIKTPPDLIEAADKALYQAKEGGRNRVEIYKDKDQSLDN